MVLCEYSCSIRHILKFLGNLSNNLLHYFNCPYDEPLLLIAPNLINQEHLSSQPDPHIARLI